MTNEQIFDTVKKIIVDHLDCNERDVTKEAMLGNNLMCDILDYVEMAMAAEQEFGIVIPDDLCEFRDTVTVQECCDRLEKIINGQ